jgi:hypothetical protein
MSRSKNISLDEINTHIRIFRRLITHLQIRENIVEHNNEGGKYSVGPTILYIPKEYLNIITENKKYDNYIFVNSAFKLPEGSKGTIFIKTSTEDRNVHLCAYTFKDNKMTIFDPAWHPVNKKGEYSEDDFYEDLQKIIKKYKPKYSYEIVKTGGDKSIQSYLGNDIFCQSWSLKWLLEDGEMEFPNSLNAVVTRIITILQELIVIINRTPDFIYLFPKEKWEIEMDIDKITRKTINNKWDEVVEILQTQLTKAKIIKLYTPS